MTKKDRLFQLFSFLEENPKDSFILFAIAKEYEKLLKEEEALEYYLKLIKIDASYVGTYYHLGKLYEKKANYQLALETYQSGIMIAKNKGDQHALSELMTAKLNLELELD